MKSRFFIRGNSCLFVARCFFVLLMLGLSSLAQAAVTAHVDRFNISEGETVNLSIEVSGNDSGDPQTAPLQKDFEILSNNHSSSFTIINGSSSSKSVYQLMLRPRHAGALLIPAIRVGSAKTEPIMIQVAKAAVRSSPAGHPSGDLWISMDIAPKQVRVQQQAIITIRVYQSVALNQAQLSEPTAEHAVIERLGDDATYQKRDNGRLWQVTERHYALFPQQSGHIDIQPVQLDGSVLIGGASFFQTAQPIRQRSNALGLEVAGIPDGWKGRDWLPARHLRIEESWPANSNFKVGEPITRTLTLHADGLTASQLPGFPSELPEHLKAYADKPVLQDEKRADGIHGVRQEKVAIMPMQAGTYILPEITFDWWNTATQQAEQATLPARTFTVIAADHAPAAATPPKMPARRAIAPQSVAPVASSGRSQARVAGVASWWRWLAIISTFGWLLTLGYIAYRRSGGNRARKNRTTQTASGNLERAEKAVETACKNNDAKACEQALLQLANLQQAGAPVHSLASLAAGCDEALKSELLKLERLLYASDRAGISGWRGDALLQAFRQTPLLSPRKDAKDNSATALPGLYPD